MAVRTLRWAGVELGGDRRLYLDDALLAQLAELRAFGLPIREIARRAGVSRTKVDRYLRINCI